jgi:hypothetical protein
MKEDLIENLKEVRRLSRIPMTNDSKTKRVEIIMLKFKEAPEVIDKAISRIIHNTDHPFKLTIFDNRLNTAHTSKIWNKLISESTCDYVCLIDSDAFVPVKHKDDKCWLTRLMESVDERGSVFPIGDKVGGINKGNEQPYGTLEYAPKEGEELVKGNHGYVCSGFCFLFRKDILKEVGWFDEDFYIYGQDSEWSIRVIEKLGTIIRRDVWVRHLGNYSFNDNPLQAADSYYARHLYLHKAHKR